jgi:hypothetical protein
MTGIFIRMLYYLILLKNRILQKSMLKKLTATYN